MSYNVNVACHAFLHGSCTKLTAVVSDLTVTLHFPSPPVKKALRSDPHYIPPNSTMYLGPWTDPCFHPFPITKCLPNGPWQFLPTKLPRIGTGVSFNAACRETPDLRTVPFDQHSFQYLV